MAYKQVILALMTMAALGFTAATTFVDCAEEAQSPSFKGQDLAHKNWSGRDLKGADFSGADLSMTDLSRADLRDSNWANADIDRVDLRGAALDGSWGWGTVDTGFGIDAREASFDDADLSGVTFEGTYFGKASFRNADLRNAILSGRFHSVDFSGAQVEGAVFLGAKGVQNIVPYLQSQGAICTPEDFALAIKNGRVFDGAYLHGCPLNDVDLAGAQLAGAELHSAKLQRTDLSRANLAEVLLNYAELAGANFSHANMLGVRASGVDGANSSFAHANLQGATFWRADLRNVDFSGANLSGVNFSYANVSGADFSGATLDGVQVKAAILTNVRGLSDKDYSELRWQAARWWHDFKKNMESLLSIIAIPGPFILCFLLICLAVSGYRRGVFPEAHLVLGVSAIVPVIPQLCFLLFILSGGATTVQLSAAGLWSSWASIWPVLMFIPILPGLVGLGLFVNGLANWRSAPNKGRRALFIIGSFGLLVSALLSFVSTIFMAPTV